jgi:hypothetical protein
MVFEYFQDLFDLDDSTNNFRHHFQMNPHVVASRILGSIARDFSVIKLLILAKPFRSTFDDCSG